MPRNPTSLAREDGMSGFDNYLISGGLVAIYGWTRFNTPKTNRTSTTLAQFYLSGLAYVASCLVLYLLVSRLIADNPETLRFLGFEAGAQNDVADLSAPLLAALLMTTLLPSVPMLQRIDVWLLEFFQRLGSIPQEVMRLSTQILGAGLVVLPRDQDAYRSALDDLPGFAEELRPEFLFEPGEKIRFRFTRIVVIFLILKRWETSRRYGTFFAGYADEFRALSDGFVAFLDEAKRFFPILRIMISVPAGDPIDPSLAECRRSFKARMEEIHRELCDFTARALLTCERGNKNVFDRLQDLGFVIATERSAVFDVNRFVSIISCIFIVFLGGGALIGSLAHQQMPIQRLIGISLMLATTYGAAVASAVIPKQLWSIADIREVGHRPAIGYLASGLFALLAAGGISLLFNIVLEWDVAKGFHRFFLNYPWLSMSFLTACSLAFLCDDYATAAAPEPAWLRWLEAGSMAVVLMAGGMLVRQWLSQIPDFPPDRIPDPRFVLPIECALGLLLGGTVPRWYRRTGLRPLASAGNGGALSSPNVLPAA
jgi:hypothetical protein